MSAPMQESFARKRHRKTEIFEKPEAILHSKDDNFIDKYLVFDGRILFIFISLFYFAIFVFVRYRINSFPEPQTQLPGSPKDAFYETNAWVHLKRFALYGPRVVGSKANEIHAYNYINQELKKIKQSSLPSKEILIDEQNVTGTFDIAFLSDFVSVYRNIKNIAVKITSETGSEQSLLMSCHFDSSVDSPGAGDNAISCAIMLEIIRVISQSSTPLHHSIIFLFNGAEENLLQASHGFITKHPWVESIKAFVNIDSAGNGGWELVFQTGPLNPWLTRAYAESAPYPSGTILGQELFQSGIIPSDTDYRIYRDFGDLPGLDIAYITNGYVYHTQNDQNRYLHAGCLQRSGENLLAVLLKLSASSHLADPGPERDGTMIFFDIVGYIMIYYPQRVAVVINSALMAAILFRIIRKTFNIDKSDNHDVKYFGNLMKAIFFMMVTWVLIVLICVAMAIFMSLLGRNMSWFTYTYNTIPLFVLPSCIAVISFHEFLKNTVFKNNIGWYNEQLFFEANMTIWGAIMLALTLNGMGSAFFPMLYVLGPLFIRDRTLWILTNKNWKGHPYKFFCLYLLSLLPPCLNTIYIGNAIFTLFIPIMGRIGSMANSDVAIGVITSVFTVFLSGYFVSLIYLCCNMKKVVSVLSVISVAWLLAIVFTPLGFPYSGNQLQPSPMRLLALHIRRRTHNIQNEVTFEDSGLWFLPFDHNSNKQLVAAVPKLQTADKLTCDLGPYCGVPFLIAVINMFHPKGNVYLRVNTHDRPDVICKKVKTEKDEIGLTKLTFEVTGPDHMTLQVRPHEGVSLERWSLSEYRPYPAAMPSDVNETTYFVYYSHGETPATPWTFSLHLKVPKNYDTSRGIVDLGLAAHYLHGEDKHTPEMDAFLAEIPDWSTPVTWTASWDGFIF